MAIYSNGSTAFSVWLVTVSSVNFSSRGFIACWRQVICTINNIAARESSQDPGYERFHTLLFTTILVALLGKHGAQGPHLKPPLPRPGVLILTLSWGSGTGIAWIGEEGPHIPWFTHMHIYMHSPHAQLLCTPAWPTSYLHPLSCYDQIKNTWHLLSVKQDRRVNYHLLTGLGYLLFPLKLDLSSTNTCNFLGHTSSFSEQHISEASSPLLRKFITFSRFVKKLAPVVPQLVPLVLLGVNYSGLLVWNYVSRCWFTSSLIQLTSFLLHV